MFGAIIFTVFAVGMLVGALGMAYIDYVAAFRAYKDCMEGKSHAQPRD